MEINGSENIANECVWLSPVAKIVFHISLKVFRFSQSECLEITTNLHYIHYTHMYNSQPELDKNSNKYILFQLVFCKSILGDIS